MKDRSNSIVYKMLSNGGIFHLIQCDFYNFKESLICQGFNSCSVNEDLVKGSDQILMEGKFKAN